MDAASLLRRRIPEGTVTIEGVGDIRVRGMSRDEALQMRGRQDAGSLEFERTIVAMCMVDPVLTEDQVAEWQRVSAPGEIEAVTDKILELSGLLESSGKAPTATS